MQQQNTIQSVTQLCKGVKENIEGGRFSILTWHPMTDAKLLLTRVEFVYWVSGISSAIKLL